MKIVTSCAKVSGLNRPTGPSVAMTGRWAYILLLLGVMHVLMDARYRIIELFPSRTCGYAVLALIYAALALLLATWKPSQSGLFSRLDAWARATLSPLFMLRRPVRTSVVCTVVLLMTIAGCLLRWVYIMQTPIAPHLADMLPLIQEACNTLASGANPYDKVYEMPWRVPMMYWPGLWMPYMIPYIMGIDLRWVHIGTVVGIASLFGAFIMRALRAPSSEEQAMLLAAFAGLFLFLFSSELIYFAGVAHTPSQWFWVSLLAVAILLKRPLLSAVFLGLVLASRQTAVVYAPLMAIYWLRTSCSLRTAVKLSIVACCTYLLICGPFLMLNTYDFIVTPLRSYAEFGKWDFTRGAESFSANSIGFTFLLRGTHVEWLPPTFTALAIIGPIVLAYLRLRTETDVLLYLGLAGVALTLTAPVPWYYEYFPSFILISFAAIAATEATPAGSASG